MWPINQPLQSALTSHVRGKVSFDLPLGPLTWFRVGGSGQIVVRPQDADDLSVVVQLAKEYGEPLTVLGVGSNIIVRDGGVPGIVVRLGGPAFTAIHVADSVMHVGAGALDRTTAEMAREHGLSGLEFLIGIPGTLGGAVRMNAGAYGREIKDLVTYVDAVDDEGKFVRIENEACGFSYRASTLSPAWIVTAVHMQGVACAEVDIAQTMKQYLEAREQTQPVRARTGGSTFKNPDGHKAWQLIDAAGCRGLERGGAMVSPLHCNFLLNTGTATAEDIEGLGEEVRQRVLSHSWITLEWEIKRIGIPGKQKS